MTNAESLEAVHTHTHTGDLIDDKIKNRKEAMYFRCI